jgi:hypothetical protein
VIEAFAEHTAGSFVVTFAPVRALFEAPKRRREKRAAVPVVPTSLSALEPETLRMLRELSMVSLAVFGVRSPTDVQLRDEMQRQFGALSASLPEGGDREAVLQQALLRATEEYEADG